MTLVTHVGEVVEGEEERELRGVVVVAGGGWGVGGV